MATQLFFIFTPILGVAWSNLMSIFSKGLKPPTRPLRIQVSPKEGISPIILFWWWDWNPQSYSREVSGFLGDYVLCFFWERLNHPAWSQPRTTRNMGKNGVGWKMSFLVSFLWMKHLRSSLYPKISWASVHFIDVFRNFFEARLWVW